MIDPQSLDLVIQLLSEHIACASYCSEDESKALDELRALRASDLAMASLLARVKAILDREIRTYPKLAHARADMIAISTEIAATLARILPRALA